MRWGDWNVVDGAYFDCWDISRHVLRPVAVNPLAKAGDADKRQLITELTLCMRNEKAHGCVADLTTT